MAAWRETIFQMSLFLKNAPPLDFVVFFDYFTNIVERTIVNEKLTRDKEEVILRSAQRRFASFGYSKVTMDEIAEDIGMAKASLYYYFPTIHWVSALGLEPEVRVRASSPGVSDSPFYQIVGCTEELIASSEPENSEGRTGAVAGHNSSVPNRNSASPSGHGKSRCQRRTDF